MIGFWNRHEVYAGFDMCRFNQILDLLAMENVRYKYRTVGQTSRGRGLGQSSRGVHGTAGVNLDVSIMYYVYVHQKDAARADGLIGQLVHVN